MPKAIGENSLQFAYYLKFSKTFASSQLKSALLRWASLVFHIKKKKKKEKKCSISEEADLKQPKESVTVLALLGMMEKCSYNFITVLLTK